MSAGATNGDRPQVGIGVLVMRNGRVLLGKRLGPHMRGYYAAPGGHLEQAESFADCARREVAEETGLQVRSVRLLTVGNYRFGAKQYVDVDLLAEVEEGEPVTMEPNKCSSWDWYDLARLPEPLFIVTRRMIDAYRHGFDLADPSILDTILVQGVIDAEV